MINETRAHSNILPVGVISVAAIFAMLAVEYGIQILAPLLIVLFAALIISPVKRVNNGEE